MAGDIADAGLNYYLVVRKAKQAECVFHALGVAYALTEFLIRLPNWLLHRMFLNNMVSVAVKHVLLLYSCRIFVEEGF